MSRRKSLSKREPNGRAQRHPPDLPSPNEIHRLRDAALAGLRDAVWATPLGRLYNTGKITGSQFAAGQRWAELSAEYSAASLAPRAPRSAALDPKGGTPPDPDSAKGRRQALLEVKIAAAYVEALVILERTGGPPRRAVLDICEYGLNPVGLTGLQNLQTGLQGLAAFWSRPRK